jgi:hypothetical protein
MSLAIWTTDTMNKITALLAALSLTSVASAQDEIVEGAVSVRRYAVELIVFAYAEDVSPGTEIFPPDEPPVIEESLLPVDPDGIIVFDETVAEPQAAATEPDVPEVEEEVAKAPWAETVLMLEDEFSMQAVIERLELLDAYEPMLHVGWTQVALPEDESQPIELLYFGDPPAGLDGSFTLYLGRYLHLVVDLALDANASTGDESQEFEEPISEEPEFDEPAIIYGDARQQFDDELPAIEGRVRYRIQEDRIMRNGDTRYFDHPKFGVIAKVSRVEERPDETEPSGDTPELSSRLR